MGIILLTNGSGDQKTQSGRRLPCTLSGRDLSPGGQWVGGPPWFQSSLLFSYLSPISHVLI